MQLGKSLTLNLTFKHTFSFILSLSKSYLLMVDLKQIR